MTARQRAPRSLRGRAAVQDSVPVGGVADAWAADNRGARRRHVRRRVRRADQLHLGRIAAAREPHLDLDGADRDDAIDSRHVAEPADLIAAGGPGSP